jgi:HJR/Mrr/RecB family endonuclease
MKTTDPKKRFSVKKTGKRKNLSLTDEQYRRLLLLVSLGCYTILEEHEEPGAGLIDVEQHILSFSEVFNSTDLVSHHTDANIYLQSDSLMAKANEIIDYYRGLVLLSELSERMAVRDIKLKGKTKEKMDGEEFEKIQFEYFNEFEINDVKNLQLIKRNGISKKK